MATTEGIQSMTPDQLLATEDYAVVRFIDGAFAWMYDTCDTEDEANQLTARMIAINEADYRVVRIQH